MQSHPDSITQLDIRLFLHLIPTGCRPSAIRILSLWLCSQLKSARTKDRVIPTRIWEKGDGWLIAMDYNLYPSIDANQTGLFPTLWPVFFYYFVKITFVKVVWVAKNMHPILGMSNWQSEKCAADRTEPCLPFNMQINCHLSVLSTSHSSPKKGIVSCWESDDIDQENSIGGNQSKTT